MARPTKATVDYFPLDADFSESIQCIENEFGNDGFVFWIKLLQAFCRHEHHFIDIRTSNPKRCLFYAKEINMPVDVCNKILSRLAEYGSIDAELFSEGIIFSENFVTRISDAYRRRNVTLLKKSDIKKMFLQQNCDNNPVNVCNNSINVDINSVNADINPQIKLNKSKVNNKEKIYKKEKFKIPTIEEISSYCSERNNRIDAQYFFDYYSSKGWLVGKSKMKDWKAAIRLWERNTKIEKREETNENVYNFD